MNKWIKRSLSIFLGVLLISLMPLQTFAIETSDGYVFKDSEGRVYEMFYENLSDDVARAYTLNSDGKVIADFLFDVRTSQITSNLTGDVINIEIDDNEISKFSDIPNLCNSSTEKTVKISSAEVTALAISNNLSEAGMKTALAVAIIKAAGGSWFYGMAFKDVEFQYD